MKEASYYKALGENKVRCRLCPHVCLLEEGAYGVCRVRVNRGGKLYTEVWDTLAAINSDPIEKKPIYHFHPGREILSIGAVGCNFHCTCCQNYTISQTGMRDFPRMMRMNAEDVLRHAMKIPGNLGVAFTYNEPSIWIEFLLDVAIKVHEKGLRNVMVSNGYINRKPLNDLLQVVDAFNIDLKSINKSAHRSFTGGELKSVLRTIETIASKKQHLEITHLVTPGVNDNEAEFRLLCRWLSKQAGKDVPLHISRYFPKYKYHEEATALNTMLRFAEIAREWLHYVYLGNVDVTAYQETRCPACNALLIRRSAYRTTQSGLNIAGNCEQCGESVISFA